MTATGSVPTASRTPTSAQKFAAGCVIKWYFDEVHDQNEFRAAIQKSGAATADADADTDTDSTRSPASMTDHCYVRLVKRGVVCFGQNWSTARCIATIVGLRNLNFRATLVTPQDHGQESVLTAVLQWFITISQINDGMCHLINNAFPANRLKSMIEDSVYLPKYIVVLLHDAMVALMANPTFKMVVAEGYIQAFNSSLGVFSNGVGIQEANVFSFSVQFLNRPIVVHTLAQQHLLFSRLLAGFHSIVNKTLGVEAWNTGTDTDMTRRILTPVKLDHIIMRFRRYIPVISDLKVCEDSLA